MKFVSNQINVNLQVINWSVYSRLLVQEVAQISYRTCKETDSSNQNNCRALLAINWLHKKRD